MAGGSTVYFMTSIGSSYTYALSSNYNGIPRLAVILVNDGEEKVITKREKYEDLFRRDVIIVKY